MSIVIDSNAPYFTEFPINNAGDAVYMTAEDSVLGNVFAIVYRAHRGLAKLSVILIGAHGVSGYVDMTLDRASRYFGACRGLAPTHFNSPVRRALAIAVLRTYATVDKCLLQKLRGMCDESSAGSLGSRFRLLYGKYPGAIGARMIEAGLISPKKIKSSMVDIVYEDNDLTIDKNNELVYLLGEQLEQLFDPLSEYSPEPAESLYHPPSDQTSCSLDDETKQVQDLCEELYLMQAHSRGDILDLLQTTLIPLRVEVLRGNFPGITIARLNVVFPPTIDELFRVNNLFYEALRSALPFGAFEVIKACGTTIPYFFRACMRHEAATRRFNQLLTELLDEVPEILPFLRTDRQKLECIIRNPLYLTNVKQVLNKLVSAKQGSSHEEQKLIDEFYAVASSTFSAFGDRNYSKNNLQNFTLTENIQDADYLDQRKLASAGKILSEITQDWPIELEYGWFNRRVISIFDAVDVLEPSDSIRQLHMVFIVFTDSLVVCQPSEPIPTTSLSGLHVPSIGDMLMHAMLNEVPIDPNLPPLKVISWAPIMDVHFASYEQQYLYIFSPGVVGSFKLLQPDFDSSKLVSLLSKAKIATKTQPFHLFKLESSETVIYSTVQELRDYRKEHNRTKIAVFLSKNITEKTLRQFGLCGALSLNMLTDGQIQVNILSRMKYNASLITSKSELQQLIVNELAYLMTLSLSSQNQEMLDIIITSNRLAANRLIKWASEPKNNKLLGHTVKPAAGVSSSDVKCATSLDVSKPLIKSYESLIPVNRILKNIPGEIMERVRDVSRSAAEHSDNELDRIPSVDGEIEAPSINSSTLKTLHRKAGSELSSEEAEQRDVDNWYHQLNRNHNDNQSLSSGLSDTDLSCFMSQRPLADSHSIQIGGVLDSNTSNLYNGSAGQAFPRIETSKNMNYPSQNRTEPSNSLRYQDSIYTLEDSFVFEKPTICNDDDLPQDEDFSYLASLVDDSSINSKLSEIEKGGVYPDLRETSLVRLGSYIIRNDQSNRCISGNVSKFQPPMSPSESVQSLSVSSDVGEQTPTVHNNEFLEACVSPEKMNWISYDKQSSEVSNMLKQELDSKSVPSPRVVDTLRNTRNMPLNKFTPYVDLESTQWHPKPVRSGTNKTLGGRVYFPHAEDFIDNSFEGDDGKELAQDWLQWTKRPLSSISYSTIVLSESTKDLKKSMSKEPATNWRLNMSESKSQVSFRRMVMSSSLHTLQLASFTVQIDQKQNSCSAGLREDLEKLKSYITLIYRSHHSASPESERLVRRNLMTFFQLLMKQNCDQLALALLEIEWVRRTRIVESQMNISDFWKHD